MSKEEDQKKEDFLLEPTRDFVFKNIFGVERNRRIVVSFLNAVLEGNPKITSVEFGNSEIPRAREDGKSVGLALLARTPEDTTIINIAIQRIDRGDTENRAYVHVSRIRPDKLEIGQDYNDIPNIILLWVTDFIVYPDIEPYLNEYTHVILPRGNDPMKIGTRKSRIFILELPKISYSVENLSNIEKDPLQLWMTFIKKPEIISEDIISRIPEIGEAMAELKRLSSDRTARALYEAELS
ncbi:MAG: Rpn family recombination-promoting nuclease/putative transposase [Rickettsiales bacterium]|jgi:predicted transposase/invertase (TIGR01784 family)|nr:Rpn family recombination-promoting nuclease/putative transposase [Rickettsiales bacterium]